MTPLMGAFELEDVAIMRILEDYFEEVSYYPTYWKERREKINRGKEKD